MPPGLAPAQLLDWAGRPGLGVTRLHERGVTGVGVAAATVDSPFNSENGEFAFGIHRQLTLQSAGVTDLQPGYHGSAVAAIFAGSRAGVAPGSTHYHIVRDGPDQTVVARALREVMRMNRDLGPSERIRVVSISWGPDSMYPNSGAYAEARDEAREAGIIVVDADWRPGAPTASVRCQPGLNRDAPANYTPSPGWGKVHWALWVPYGGVTVPSGSPDPADYTYWGVGGQSWAIPFLAGLVGDPRRVHPNG